MSEKDIKYMLFCNEVVKNICTNPMSVMYGQEIPEEEWKEGDPEDKKPEKELVFVAYVTDPKELAGIIRKDPLKEYLLFIGEISTIKIAMPVMVDGKSLDTMESEWSVK